MKVKMVCAHCGNERMRESGQVNRAARNGAKLFCSRECGYRAKATGRNALGWHERRFEERDGAVKTDCSECGVAMWLPPTKLKEYKRCSKACNTAWRERERLAAARACESCGKTFHPRPAQIRSGVGRYCSRGCIPTEHLTGADNLAKAQDGRRAAILAGRIWWATGPNHHSWKGGEKACLQRRVQSGKAAAGLRRYRAKNPHKVREFSARRKGRKLGRLEYGCIPRIGEAQKWRCAICRTSVLRGYHVDHIIPLAKGGEHKARNIQLLCGPCNLRKSNKDPIRFMQELGRLL